MTGVQTCALPISIPYLQSRLDGWTHDLSKMTDQTLQSLYAIGSGGVTGLGSATAAPDPVVKFSDVTVDLAARVIHRGEEEVHLTPIEFRLLAVLLNNAGKVLTQRQLLNQVWGPNAVEHSHYLRIYMGHLRQKLEQDPARPRHFITETGIGYRFML